jgi:two-component system, NarL family, captular synthesis response regulator RcsB
VNLRIVLADDHPFVLLGMRCALVAVAGIEIVGEAASSSGLFRTLQTVPCDVVVTDLTMPGNPRDPEDGLLLVWRLRREWPSLRVVVLTGITNVAILRAVLNAGVAALVRKSESLDELVRAVRGVRNDRVYVGSAIRGGVASAGEYYAHRMRTLRLSPRESEVIRQFASGRTVTEIAKLLQRDVRTVSRQKRDAMTKLGLSNDPGLIAFMRAYGLT